MLLNNVMGVVIPAPGSATYAATRRLQKDYLKLAQDPIDGITAIPNESNILEWHYCLRGSPDTYYEGGYYWGKMVFKPDFPWSPPAIIMITPNGRFETNMRLCLSISDYHPESWNPGWTVSAILVGLHSFMNERSHAAGVLNEGPAACRQHALKSKDFNCQSAEFVKFFPGMASDWAKEKSLSGGSFASSSSGSGGSSVYVPMPYPPSASAVYAAAGIAAPMPIFTARTVAPPLVDLEEPPYKRSRVTSNAPINLPALPVVPNRAPPKEEDVIVLD